MTQPKEKRPAVEAGKEPGAQEPKERSYGWVLPVGALAAIGAVALAYFFGLLGEAVVAMIASVLFAVVLAGVIVHAGFESPNGAVRAATLLCAVLTLGVIGYSSAVVLVPGSPVATNTLREPGASMALPAPGSYRLQVSARLPASGEPRIAYRLGGGAGSVEGVIERVFGTARARRGPATRVAQDHDMAGNALMVAGEPPLIKLESLRGEGSKGGVTVRAFKVLSPSVIWAVVGLLLALATVLEGRLRRSQSMLVASVVGAAIFVPMIEWATPRSAMGPVLGSALLATGGGVFGGALLGAIGRKLFGPRNPVEPEAEEQEEQKAPAKPAPKRKAG